MLETPGYQKIIETIARRDQCRILDEITLQVLKELKKLVQSKLFG
jgi:hypothetical protein